MTDAAPEEVESAPGRPGWIRRMLPFLRPHRADLVLVFGAALTGMVASASIPLLMRKVVDESILHVHGKHTPIAPLLLVLIVVGLLRLGLSFVRRFGAGRVGIDLQYDLRNAIYDHLQRLDFARHDELQTGQLVSRANTDINSVQNLFGFLPTMSANFFQ